MIRSIGEREAIIFGSSSYDPSAYLDKNYEPKENAMKLVLFKMINGEEVEGFE